MKKKVIILGLIGILILCGYYFVINRQIPMNEIEQVLLNEVEANKSPSVQYYLFDKDKIIYEYNLGYANIDKQIKTDNSTKYNAFSVTKTFTALAILQLSEQNKIDIEQPIINYLPEFAYGSDITVRQILNHSAGIPNPIPLSWIHLVDEHQTFNRNDFFKSVIDKNNKVKSEPNEKFSYSNIGYIILGQLIEKISGKTYEDYVAENIINKLSLNEKDLSFEFTDSSKYATGYHKKISFSNLILGFLIDKSKFMNKSKGKWKSFKKYYVNGTSYGGLIGTPIAFVKYVQEFLTDDNQLLSEKHRTLFFQENINNKNENTGMCLSWFTGDLNGNKYFTHAGGGGGYYCEIRIYPNLKIGSVIFLNRTGMSDERFLDKLDSIFIDKLNANR